jgi:hypothetical protein
LLLLGEDAPTMNANLIADEQAGRVGYFEAALARPTMRYRSPQ